MIGIVVYIINYFNFIHRTELANNLIMILTGESIFFKMPG